MDVVRRVYLYVVAATSLGMLIAGICNLGGSLIEMASGTAVEETIRRSLAFSGALVVVGLPIWALHWRIADRAARANPADRRSALRRLYLYGTAAVLLIAFAVAADQLVEHLLGALARTDAPGDAAGAFRAIWQALITAFFWAYQLRCAAVDRPEVGEERESGIIRRWYAYGVQLVALLTVLFTASTLLRTIGLFAIDRNQLLGETATLATIARLLVALLIWIIHDRWTARGKIGLEDRRSTLRAVYGFLVLGLSVCLTLVDASKVLYYVLARALGVARPGGVGDDIVSAVVNPASTMMVFGAAWALMRHRLARDAAEAVSAGPALEEPRQVGVRRLYTHLVAFVALGTWTAGLTGVVWTLSDRLLGAQAPSADAWRDQLSLSLTLIAVGLPTWLGHWHSAGNAAERLALSRRLYLFAALLTSVLALLGSGTTLAYSLLGQLIAVPGASISPIGRALAASLVAAAIGAYHWRVLRADLAARRSLAMEEQVIPDGTSGQVESLVVEIVGATEADVRRALAALPTRATYSLRALDRPPGTQ